MKEELKKFLIENDDSCWEPVFTDKLDKLLDSFFDQYQPERSKREDLNECVLCKCTINTTRQSKDDVCDDCHLKIIKQIHSRCGALNSEETH